MDNKIKLKSKIIKPYKINYVNQINMDKNSPLHKLMDVYFIHKITPSMYENIVK